MWKSPFMELPQAIRPPESMQVLPSDSKSTLEPRVYDGLRQHSDDTSSSDNPGSGVVVV